MYTIKQASQRTGVSESSLRAWERRYGVVVPLRTPAGYRVYDEEALRAVSSMRRLVGEGWSPAQAADAVRSGAVPGPSILEQPATDTIEPPALSYTRWFLASAAQLDTAGIERSLDGGFALGSFEHVIEEWLFPTLEALGDGWARGDIDVAGEHAASHAVHRRLSAAFDAAASNSRGPAVVVGLPPSSQHSLGALAFATAIRRRGLDVLYLGSDVPVTSWEAAVRSRPTQAAVMAVVTPEDRPPAVAVAERLLTLDAAPLVCAGGAAGERLAPTIHTLPSGIGAAAEQLDALTHAALTAAD